jgi:hypothetical protein
MTITELPPVLTPAPVTDRSPELLRHAGFPVHCGPGSRVPVHVTQDDINAGTPGDGAACPVALAIQRALPGAKVHIGATPTINGRVIGLGADIADWIGRYDRGEHVDPFTIQLSGDLRTP